MASSEGVHAASSRTHTVISWILLAGLLLLRLAVEGVVQTLAPTPWLDPLAEICTYHLTLGFIWWERDRLALFHIDALVIMMIVILKPLQTLFLAITPYESMLAFPNPPSLTVWVGAAVLFFAMRKKRPDLLKIQGTSWRWFGIGALVGVGQALLGGYLLALQSDGSMLAYEPRLVNVLLPLLPLFVYHISYAAIAEEPLLRGFLWGHLRNAGWGEVWIWLFQTLLFALGHVYYIHELPLSFWVIVPVGGLVFGLLAWKTRTIASSMAAHGLSNALSQLVAPYFD